MKDRFTYLRTLVKEGQYQARGLMAGLAGLVAACGVLAALDPALLPSQLLPFQQQIHDLGKWAVLIGLVAGGVAAQSKPPLPKPPAPLEDPQ